MDHRKAGTMHNLEVAFHQAGHVVMAMLWGVWRVDKVSLAGMGNGGKEVGHPHLSVMEGQDRSQEIESRFFDANLERILGGPVARSLLLGWDARSRGSAEDPDFDCLLGEVQDCVPGISPAEARALIREHEPIVRGDLKRIWPVVEALAVELVCNGELYDYQIRSIIRTAVNKLPESERGWTISRLRNTASHQGAQSSS